jgi:hypothetical protein
VPLVNIVLYIIFPSHSCRSPTKVELRSHGSATPAVLEDPSSSKFKVPRRRHILFFPSMFIVEQTVRDLPEQNSTIHTNTPTFRHRNRESNTRLPTVIKRSPSTQETMTKSRASAEKEVRSWGFGHVFTWTDGP